MRKSNTPSAILCSDLHLREDTPTCRTDNYWLAQETKTYWLKSLQLKYNCPVLCSGDIFDNWDISPRLSAWAIRQLPKMIAIPGQHDLPNHNIELREKAGIEVLEAANIVTSPEKPYENEINKNNYFLFPYGSKLKEIKKADYGRDIALIHTLVLGPRDENMPGYSAREIFKQMSGFDLIVSGDNHQSFVIKQGKQLLVNPGSMMRMTADQIDYKPCVYLWYAETNTVEPVYYPIEEGVVSREHLDKKASAETRMEAFKNRLHREGIKASISFENNMKKHIHANKVDKEVEKIIYECLEDRK